MTPHCFSALVRPIPHATHPKCQNDFLLDHFKWLVGAIQFGRELSTRSVHGGPPQPRNQRSCLFHEGLLEMRETLVFVLY